MSEDRSARRPPARVRQQREGRRPRGGERDPGTREHSPRRDEAVSHSRKVAWELLRQVREQDAYANLAMPALLRAARLAPRDAAFATELAYGTLRLQGRYDPIIDAAAGRGPGDIDAPVRDVLRLTAHQLFGMRVPAHAAVSQGVALARSVASRGAGGFVNAVARAMTTHTLAEWLEQVAPGGGVASLAVRSSHPAWVVRALTGALTAHGRAAGEIDALVEADNTPARVTLVARPGLIEPGELAAQVRELDQSRPETGDSAEDAQHAERPGIPVGRLAPTAVGLPHGDPGGLPAVRHGLAAVQDEGSQLAALLLAQSPLTGADARWLDMCAGPGGKAALLGAVARQRGATLVANESQEHRAELVRRACGALGDTVTVQVRDGRELPEEATRYDRVLLDAPCSGLGALRRRPEARWRRTPSDIGTLTALQEQLLGAALECVRPGGLVAYVTCSPHPAETEAIVTAVLRRHGATERVDLRELRPDLVEAHALTPSGALQLWPDLHGTDAMYLALLRRTP